VRLLGSCLRAQHLGPVIRFTVLPEGMEWLMTAYIVYCVLPEGVTVPTCLQLLMRLLWVPEGSALVRTGYTVGSWCLPAGTALLMIVMRLVGVPDDIALFMRVHLGATTLFMLHSLLCLPEGIAQVLTVVCGLLWHGVVRTGHIIHCACQGAQHQHG
jgi:hypothetical protein